MTKLAQAGNDTLTDKNFRANKLIVCLVYDRLIIILNNGTDFVFIVNLHIVISKEYVILVVVVEP